MTVTESDPDPALAAATAREIDRVRREGGLGESGRLRELFDFLVERSGDPLPPKEVEIAVAVFGKPETDTLKDDPVARVYVHRLRKRLDEFYRREGAPDGVRLDVPKGQYRVVGQRVGGDAPAASAGSGPDFGRLRPGAWRLLAAGAAALVLLNIAAWAVLGGRDAEPVSAHPIWAPMANTGRPLVIVAGDYYMFGDYGDSPFLRRLVRDFTINSREELLRRRMENAEDYDRYTDVNLQYLPVSVAYAMARIMPGAPDKPTRTVLASDLTPEMLRDYDVLYIGLLSGLGMLRDPVFARSRFAVGDSYDEMVDTETDTAYFSEGFATDSYDGMYRDYGFFSSFDGPAGNRIVVIAGARDAGVSGVAERLSSPAAYAALQDAAGDSGAFEALYEVEGQQNVSLDARLLAAAPVDSGAIWAFDGPAREFPAE